MPSSEKVGQQGEVDATTVVSTQATGNPGIASVRDWRVVASNTYPQTIYLK